MELVETLRQKNRGLYDCLLDIKKFSLDIWKDKLLPWFTNHNVDHSDEIIQILGQILQPLEDHKNFLSEDELFILLASSYLHDIGMQYIKIDDIPITELTDNYYSLIRRRHAEESYNIIQKKVCQSVSRDDFHLPKIDESYLNSIALVSKGHSTDFFDEVLNRFGSVPESPKGRPIRGELLTALLLIADELDLQSKRVEFPEGVRQIYG